ncbi:MAG: peptidoglycan editing factor PgeF [Desulfatirhabdiaceae bacterium]
MNHMIHHRHQGLTWLQFPHLTEYKHIRHGIFTRQGGFSLPPYQGLNVSGSNGDDPDRVHRNRCLISEQMGHADMVFIRQTHGVTVFVVTAHSLPMSPPLPEADALVTQLPQKNLMIQVADCQAILIYDPIKQVVANIHSGWRGSIGNIVGKTIQTMLEIFQCSPQDMLAGIGPSLGPCCSEFVNYRMEIPKAMWGYRLPKNHFDFWAMTEDQLVDAGVPRTRIQQSGLCTRCRTDLFFSYRREKQTGRFAALIGMTDETM